MSESSAGGVPGGVPGGVLGEKRAFEKPICSKGNLPSGITHLTTVLTDEQAFDVAAYVNSQPRPVKKRLEADFPARKNKPVDAAFPPYTPGFSAEQHKYGPWQPIQAAREKGVYPPK